MRDSDIKQSLVGREVYFKLTDPLYPARITPRKLYKIVTHEAGHTTAYILNDIGEGACIGLTFPCAHLRLKAKWSLKREGSSASKTEEGS